MKKAKGSLKRPEDTSDQYHMHLYFAGQSPRTSLAIANVKRLCAERIPHGCKLKFVDLYENPGLAKTDQIVATPTLVKKFPLPERRVIGDLSDLYRLSIALGLE